MQSVAESVKEAPRLSCRRRSQELKITKTSLHSILRSDLHLTPYLVPVKQPLSEQDVVVRREMSAWFLMKLEENRDWIDHVWFSDESHFCLYSAVNRRSNVYWGEDKPTFVNERPLHSPNVTVERFEQPGNHRALLF